MLKKIKPDHFLALVFSILILCYQVPAWGTAGFGETPFYTPEGDMFGMDGQNGKKANIMGDNHFRDHGYYEDATGGKFIAGEDKSNQFKLFDRVHKKTLTFSDRNQLCSYIKSKELKFNPNSMGRVHPRISLNFPVINQLNRFDYYVIRYSLYLIPPFLGLLIVYNIVVRDFTKSNSPFEKRIDNILRSKFFSVPVTLVSMVLNVQMVNRYYSDSFLFLSVFVLPFMSYIAWYLARNSLQVFDGLNLLATWTRKKLADPQIVYFKSFVFLGILMIVMSLSLGSCQAIYTSDQYFYCG
jgi:hypothetical protein